MPLEEKRILPSGKVISPQSGNPARSANLAGCLNRRELLPLVVLHLGRPHERPASSKKLPLGVLSVLSGTFPVLSLFSIVDCRV